MKSLLKWCIKSIRAKGWISRIREHLMRRSGIWNYMKEIRYRRNVRTNMKYVSMWRNAGLGIYWMKSMESMILLKQYLLISYRIDFSWNAPILQVQMPYLTEISHLIINIKRTNLISGWSVIISGEAGNGIIRILSHVLSVKKYWKIRMVSFLWIINLCVLMDR